MEPANTLLLARGDVASFLNIEECIIAVEQAFKLYAEGQARPPKVLGIHTGHGGFHIKAGILELKNKFFVAKANANFPANAKQYGLPAIQGIIIVSDAENGKLLALMDSIEITIIRTGAATAVAAKYLSSIDAKTITICGCGNQGKISLKAIMKVRQLKKVFAFDADEKKKKEFAEEFAGQLDVIPVANDALSAALKQSEICVTCTPSKQPFIRAGDIMPGTFIAAVGADSEEKQELCSDLLVSAKIVTDMTEQSAAIGELHHAIEQGLITIDGVYAELGMIIAGKKPGRESKEEIIIFDSTGTALQDVAAAAIVYEKALLSGICSSMNFADQTTIEQLRTLKQNQKDLAALSSFYPFR